MAILIKTTKDISTHGVKMLVYGQAGVGKTMLIKTLPAPIILSAEAGLLSLQNENMPFIQIATLAQLSEAFTWLQQSTEARKYKSVAIDSLSEIAEFVLASEKQNSKDPRKAYGAMQDKMTNIIKGFRDLKDFHVYFTAKVERTQDETGMLLYGPSLPGQKMSQLIPYFFDEVLALRLVTDKENNIQRLLMTTSDGMWTAKDRSGKLSAWEPANLETLIRKIGGTSNA